MMRFVLFAVAIVASADGHTENLVPASHHVHSLRARSSLQGPAEPFCFVSFGCWGGHNLATQRTVAKLMERVVEKMARFPVTFVIAAGDNFYKKGVTSVNDKRFKRTFEDVYRSPTLDKVPFLVALGNHDYRGDFFAQVNYTTQQFAVEESSGAQRGSGRWYLPHPYYSIQVASDVVVTVLDGPLFERCHNNGNESPRCWDHGFQRQWVEQQLLTTYRAVRYKIVVCHYPLHANGPHINFPWLIEWLQPLLERADVALYINADNHYLQVSYVGPVYYVNSGGGAGIGVRHTPQNRGYRRSPHDVFTDISDGVFLHCISESRDELVSEAIRTDDKVLFRFASKKLAANMSSSGVTRREATAMSDSSRLVKKGSGDVHSTANAEATARHIRLADEVYAANNNTYAMAMIALVLILGGCFVAHRRNGGRTLRKK